MLTLGQGSWQQGFASVTLQLWEAGSGAPMQVSGSLPIAPDLDRVYRRWRSLYEALYDACGSRRRSLTTDPDAGQNVKAPGSADPRRNGDEASPADDSAEDSVAEGSADSAAPSLDFPIDVDEDDVTHVSGAEFVQLGHDLRHQLNSWLESPTFRLIDRQLRTQLGRSDEIRVVVAAEDREVLRYPWQLWQLFEDYPHAELALSSINYQRSVKRPHQKTDGQVTVLAVLGNAQDIDVEMDRQLLSTLPGAAVTVLAEPSLDDLHQKLWQGSWDILFFAGHSSSQNQGVLQLNRRDTISLVQLQYALRRAIAQGLQLAIFNSCDGLGLAWDLADLHIPQVIVMREPVPDGVAHAFLKHFLMAFAEGQPLYLAVRAAREQLQALEQLCPCATWLPVIVQNPAEQPVTWDELKGTHHPSSAALEKAGGEKGPLPLKIGTLWMPLLMIAAVMGLRLLGSLELVELYVFDRLMRMRSAELPDPRFLVVTISEADIRAQPPERRGSLSDEALDRLLTVLDRHQARVIGLDIYRDYPVSPNHPTLAARLRAGDRLVGVCKSRDPTVDPIGVDPPPELTEELVGFSDFLDDRDGVVRRHLVSLAVDPVATCTTPYAFSARLAFLYLQGEDITPRFDAGGNLVIGDALFPRLRSRSGGYQPIDAAGNQILLNYRALSSPRVIADRVSLAQVLDDKVNPEAIANRIVLIGVTASSMTDDWATPYGTSSGDKTAGVFLQAQMTSQLISAALGDRSVLRVWPLWGELLWIGGWAVGGWVVGRSQLGVGLWRPLALGGLGLVVLVGGSLWLLVAGYWVPLVPAALAFAGSGIGIISRSYSRLA